MDILEGKRKKKMIQARNLERMLLNYKNMRFENSARGKKVCFCFFFPTSILYSCVFAQPVMGCIYLTMQIDYRQNYSIKY